MEKYGKQFIGAGVPKIKEFCFSRTYCLLLSILLLSLVLRIFALLSLKGSVYYSFLIADEGFYHDRAVKIATGTDAPSLVYDFYNLPIFLMSLVYKVFSPDVLYVRLMNVVFGVLICLLIYLVGRELVNRITGIFSCLAAAVYTPFIFYSIVPLKTSVSIFLFALVIYLLVVSLNRISIVRVLILGVAMGFLINVRPNFLVIVPFLPAVLIWELYKGKHNKARTAVAVTAYIAGICISVSPFFIRDLRASGKPSLSNAQAGINLYVGNNLENEEPYFKPPAFAYPSPFVWTPQFIIEASRREGIRLSPGETSAYWTREALRTAVEQPVQFLRKILKKTLVFFNHFEAGDHYHIGFMSKFVPFFKFPLLCFWMVFPFGLAGIFIGMVKDRKFSYLCMILFLYGLTLILFFTNTRYRLPLMVILIPGAVYGIGRIIYVIRHRRPKEILIYSFLVGLFFAIEFIPARKTYDLNAYYHNHALALYSKGHRSQAVNYLKKSSNLFNSDKANITLGSIYLVRDDLREALFYLARIPDDSPYASAPKFELMGDIMKKRGNPEGAIMAYRKSLDINSGRRGPRKKLISLYEKIDRQKASQERKRLKYINSFYDE